jgi:hypothetical protein
MRGVERLFALLFSDSTARFNEYLGAFRKATAPVENFHWHAQRARCAVDRGVDLRSIAVWQVDPCYITIFLFAEINRGGKACL